ncbi:hypothetical protein NC651_005078 [Populus alba x Populus x berolinensis]|nr:hypothetical protein NC651_005078 [Populus alba x Populus x berolinensis]
MAKTTFVPVLPLMLLLSTFRTVLSTEDQGETISDHMNQAASYAKESLIGKHDTGLVSGNHQLKGEAGPAPAPAPISSAGPRDIRLGSDKSQL